MVSDFVVIAYVSLSADKIVESNLDTQTLVSTLNHATVVKTVMLKIVNAANHENHNRPVCFHLSVSCIIRIYSE